MSISDNTKILYHGSHCVIERPEFGLGKADNDFGSGFYTTEDKDAAEEWAVANRYLLNAVCNIYKIDITGLNIINLCEHGILAWIAETVCNRGVRDRTAEILGEMIAGKYKTDTSKADIIVGYTADNSYTLLVEAFLLNKFTVEEVENIFQKGEPELQVVIKSKEAFSRLQFVSSETVAMNFYNRDLHERRKIKELIKKRDHDILIEGFDVSAIGLTARNAVKTERCEK